MFGRLRSLFDLTPVPPPQPPDPIPVEPALFGDSLAEFSYETSDMEWTFACTGRRTTLRYTRPVARDGAAPTLVIVSHGLATANGEMCLDGYKPAIDALCKTGRFATIQPLYLDGQDPQAGTKFWKERRAELDELVARRSEIGVFAAKVGVLGHSYGADTSIGVIGMSYRGNRLVNPDVRAACLWSPQGVDARMDDEGAWDALTAPILSITGLLDDGRLGDDYTWRLQPHENATVSRTLLVHRVDHGHGGATGNPLRIQDPPTCATVCDATLAFFCAKLQNDELAAKFLQNGKAWLTELVQFDSK